MKLSSLRSAGVISLTRRVHSLDKPNGFIWVDASCLGLVKARSPASSPHDSDSS